MFLKNRGKCIFFVLVFSCNSKVDKQAVNDTTLVVDIVKKKEVLPIKSVKNDRIIFDSTYDRTAAYIAGVNQPSHNVIERDSVWYKYAANLDKSWSSSYFERYDVLHQWADSEFTHRIKIGDVLFYPFSGADFLNSYTLFPNYKTYLLIGLEPVGALPDLQSKSKEEIYSYLEKIDKSLYDFIHNSFFHTKKMKVHFKSEEVNGVIPDLSIFIKRTGHVITNIESVQLDSVGKVQLFAYDSLLSPEFKADGVKISFHLAGNSTPKQLFYFSQNLNDKVLTKKSPIYKYLDGQYGFFTYLKSASYLMHYPNYSLIRHLILKNSFGLLQDDTGIPYRYFDSIHWDLRLYGNYVAPSKPFTSALFFQKDLNEIYRKDSTIEALPFTLGYNQKKGKTNLLLGLKK
jgi:hypothetical protein